MTMHVRFLKTFPFTPTEDRRATVVYKAKWTGTVRRQCGEKAVRLGYAVEVPLPPPRSRRPTRASS